MEHYIYNNGKEQDCVPQRVTRTPDASEALLRAHCRACVDDCLREFHAEVRWRSQDVRIRLRQGTHIDVAVIHGFQHQVDIGHIASKNGTRSVWMVARDNALEFTVLVASDIRHAVCRPFPFDQVGKHRWIPMKVRINHRLAVVVFWLRSDFLRAFRNRLNQR
jgi:hypothetical protein